VWKWPHLHIPPRLRWRGQVVSPTDYVQVQSQASACEIYDVGSSTGHISPWALRLSLSVSFHRFSTLIQSSVTDSI
jgi:hypothetical protein